jgi:uncharacterized protein (DUF2267 family)
MEVDTSLGNALEEEPSGLSEIARDIEQHAPLRDPETGSDALTAVLCSLSRTLDIAEVLELVELLPSDLRPLMQACPIHREEDPGATSADVVERIGAHLGMDAGDAERTAAVVLEAILERIPLDAAERLAQMLPPELRSPRPG